jgi:hypothetical protein
MSEVEFKGRSELAGTGLWRVGRASAIFGVLDALDARQAMSRIKQGSDQLTKE